MMTRKRLRSFCMHLKKENIFQVPRGQHRGAANQAGVQGGAEERGDEQKSN